MNLWIKICANTTLEDALLAAEAGADAVGFVFAPSPRRVTRETVAEIIPQLPSRLEKIGVFVDAPFEEIVAIVEATGLTGVQLHFEPPPDLPARLRSYFGSGLRILRVMHFKPQNTELLPGLNDPDADAILIDSRTASAVGGTGQRFDWSLAGKTLFQDKTRMRLIAAGGLRPENVAEAIAVLAPWGVDVVSGVETAPGKKDAAKVRAFVANARAADSGE